MGNRVVVVFTDGKGEYSPCVYLHWNASELGEFLTVWRERMKGREGDVQYGAARFVGVCHERIAGNLSLGIWDSRILPGDDAATDRPPVESSLRAHDPGDAGVAVVNVTDYTVRRLSTTEYAMLECPVPDGWKIPATRGSVAGAWFALPMLPHVGHDGGLHHTIPMLLAGLLLGWILLAVRRARRVRR